MNFGEKLKQIRQEKGISQRLLGERLGVTQQTIAQYEKIQDLPKAATVRKLADALDIQISDFFDNEQARVLSAYANNKLDTIALLQALDRYHPNAAQNIVLQEVLEKYDKKRNGQKETEILSLFEQLNELGQEKAVEQIALLTKIPEYQKAD